MFTAEINSTYFITKSKINHYDSDIKIKYTISNIG